MQARNKVRITNQRADGFGFRPPWSNGEENPQRHAEGGYGISTTRDNSESPLLFARRESSASSSRAATRKASISLRTRNSSCSFIRSTSYGFFIGGRPHLRIQTCSVCLKIQ